MENLGKLSSSYYVQSDGQSGVGDFPGHLGSKIEYFRTENALGDVSGRWWMEVVLRRNDCTEEKYPLLQERIEYVRIFLLSLPLYSILFE